MDVVTTNYYFPFFLQHQNCCVVKPKAVQTRWMELVAWVVSRPRACYGFLWGHRNTSRAGLRSISMAKPQVWFVCRGRGWEKRRARVKLLLGRFYCHELLFRLLLLLSEMHFYLYQRGYYYGFWKAWFWFIENFRVHVTVAIMAVPSCAQWSQLNG